MSSRSNMQMSSSRAAVPLPDTVVSALEIRSRSGLVCPPAVEAKLKTLSFFTKSSGAGSSSTPSATAHGIHRVPSTPQAAQASNRFGNLGRMSAPDGWRTSGPVNSPPYSSSHSTQQKSEDGFEVWTNKRKQGGGNRYSSYPHSGSHSTHAHAHAHAQSPRTTEPTTTTNITSIPISSSASSTPAWKSSRFQPLEEKLASESIENRIMGKIRSKINMIGESTYVPTKAFMQQILDSGETDFLEEFMNIVFQKAATEPNFCGVYAKLLHELGDEFQHLRIEMQNRFREYTAIFDEAEHTPDVGTGDYTKFVEAQERKKFRRGYSQFVAELAKYGEIDKKDFQSLVELIVKSIQTVYTIPDNTLLCEEYVDCLLKMCKASASILAKSDWIQACLITLEAIGSSVRSSAPGLSNKARFAILDILDFAKAGWRK